MYDAIILAGGDARRLGGVAKPQLEVGGVRLLDLALAAVAGASRVVIAGPRQRVDATSSALRWVREDPPGGGPVAAVAAAMAQTSADVVVVLAADQPWIAPAVPLLVAAVPAGGVAQLVTPDGRVNHLAAAWDRIALAAALAALGTPAGTSMRALVSATPTASVADTGGWGLDCDTPADLARARGEHGRTDTEAWAASQIRIARPSKDLAVAERFWTVGLGLEVLFRADGTAEGGHALLMLGWPAAAWHLELVHDPGSQALARPTEEDLLVIYTATQVDRQVIARLVAMGGVVADSPNPYWNRWGETIVDPDGYRLVLSSRSWP